MPITLQINHPDRIVVGVATGTLVAADLERFAEELQKANAHRYRKIIDVAAARSGLTPMDIAAFTKLVLSAFRQTKRGPIALVTNEENSALARLFASLAEDERPAKAFRSIHEARRWLQENSRIE